MAGDATTLVMEAAILTMMGSTAIVATGVLVAGVPLVIGAVVGTAVTVAIDSHMERSGLLLFGQWDTMIMFCGVGLFVC